MYAVFIVNPKSGNGKALEVAKVIDNYCKNNKIYYKIIYTNSSEETKQVAYKYSNFLNTLIYSVGGDGTLNDIINGMEYSHNFINVIPAGSGNDFYKSIKDKDEITCDLGIVNKKRFINIASIGLDANVANEANILKNKNYPTKLVYPLGLIKTFNKYKGNKVYINGVESNNNILAICNGKYYGGGFKIGPEALVDDGCFDICEIDYKNKINSLKLLSKLLKGEHHLDKEVKYYKDDKIIVDSNVDLPCNVDGEIIYDKHFNFILKKNCITVNHDPLNINKMLKYKKLIK